MRKWIAAVMLAAMVILLAVPAQGAEDGLEVPDVTVQPGETVYLTFKLTKPVTGNSVAVTYTCDREVLKPIESSSTWERKGMLQDFDTYKMTGVWAAQEAVELEGDICTVAFRVVTEEAHFDTKVTCTVKVKNGAAEVADFTEEVLVSTACDHSYGAWTEDGSVSHQRTCSICSRKQQQAHKWDEGTVGKDQNNADVLLFSCTECGAKKEVPYLSGSEQSTVPTQNTEPEDHDHDHGTTPTEDDGHDHSHTVVDRKTQIRNALVLFGTVGVLAVGAWFVVKKKR